MYFTQIKYASLYMSKLDSFGNIIYFTKRHFLLHIFIIILILFITFTTSETCFFIIIYQIVYFLLKLWSIIEFRWTIILNWNNLKLFLSKISWCQKSLLGGLSFFWIHSCKNWWLLNKNSLIIHIIYWRKSSFPIFRSQH